MVSAWWEEKKKKNCSLQYVRMYDRTKSLLGEDHNYYLHNKDIYSQEVTIITLNHGIFHQESDNLCNILFEKDMTTSQ
jgi:hypothetical protein